MSKKQNKKDAKIPQMSRLSKNSLFMFKTTRFSIRLKLQQQKKPASNSFDNKSMYDIHWKVYHGTNKFKKVSVINFIVYN